MTILHIATHEFRTALRDRRLMAAFGVMVLLLFVAAFTGWQQQQQRAAEHTKLVGINRTQWDAQEAKNPHSAAHYGNFVFRPEGPLGFWDGGINAFTGSTIYLEPHKQNNANFSAVQESSAALRLGRMDVAFVLQLLLPLLLIFLAFDTFTKEKESQRIKMLLAQGASMPTIAAGKTLGVWGMATLATLPVLLLAVLLTAAREAVEWPRLLLWIGAYWIFTGIVAALVVCVSAYSSSTGLALVRLLGLWIGLGILLPKISSNLGESMAQAPSNAAFAEAIKKDVKNGIDGHNPADQRRKELEARILIKYGVDSIRQLPVNIGGLAMLESEVYTSNVYNRHFDALQACYARQNRVAEWAGVLNPMQAIRQLSAGLAGTDTYANLDFQRRAEEYRLTFVNQLNHFLAYNFKGNQDHDDMKASQEVLRAIPPFEYAPPGWSAVLHRHALSLSALAFWVLIAFGTIFSTTKIRPA